MASKKIEDYAVRHGLSNNAAKRRLRHKQTESALPVRGAPVPGTGRPKGQSKK